MNPSSHDLSHRHDRNEAGSHGRRHRSAQATDHAPRRNRGTVRALRCHDVRCVEADQEIRDVLRRS